MVKIHTQQATAAIYQKKEIYSGTVKDIMVFINVRRKAIQL